MENKHIKDSGEKREFETGAHRDGGVEDKAMPIALPMDVVAEVMDDDVLREIGQFVRDHDTAHVIRAIRLICEKCPEWENMPLAMMDVSFHYKEGGKKYGLGNWTYGMPIEVYFESGMRHYLKWLGGMTDEPHHRAAVWNLLNLVWTWEHVPNSKEEFAKRMAEIWHN